MLGYSLIVHLHPHILTHAVHAFTHNWRHFKRLGMCHQDDVPQALHCPWWRLQCCGDSMFVQFAVRSLKPVSVKTNSWSECLSQNYSLMYSCAFLSVCVFPSRRSNLNWKQSLKHGGSVGHLHNAFR